MFERYTDRSRRVVVLAQEEARTLKHNYIGTEHILLGLLHEAEGIGAQALTALGLDLEKCRAAVLEIIGHGLQAPSGHIPFTPRAKKVLELSLREALILGHNYIGTEHLLLALVRSCENATPTSLTDPDAPAGGGVGCKIITDAGLTLNHVRQKVIQLLTGVLVFGAEWYGNVASQTVYYVRCPYCGNNVTDGTAHATKDAAIVAAKEAGAATVASSIACKACQSRPIADFAEGSAS